MANVLVIDDDEGVCYLLARMVKQDGHSIACRYTLQEGLAELLSGNFDIIFLDLKLPDGNGMDVLPEILKASSKPEVIIMTGHGDKDGAELAIKYGAWDYISKSSSIEAMKLPFIRALHYREKKSKQKTPRLLKRKGIVGNSPEIDHCLSLVAKAASTDVNVLLIGETGTGKELFARAIHENSHRAKKALVVVDCATLPDNLIESILFGHERGAFTGADRQREGLIREADGGTLFLDEVGELPLQQQKAFLRVLQERRFRPVGSKRHVVSDFRLVAATNQNIDKMIKAVTFREDLFFRLQALSINLPPLRNRADDIRVIASHYISKLSGKYGLGPKYCSTEFLEAITAYNWPGNVRELFNAIENALSESSEESMLFRIHLPFHIRSWLVRESVIEQPQSDFFSKSTTDTQNIFPKLKDLISTTEMGYFRNLIASANGDIKEICRISGLSRSNVYTRFKKYNLTRFVL